MQQRYKQFKAILFNCDSNEQSFRRCISIGSLIKKHAKYARGFYFEIGLIKGMIGVKNYGP